MGSLLALGIGIGAYAARGTPTPSACASDALAQRRLDDLDENVRRLTAAYQRTAAALAVQSVAMAQAPSTSPPPDDKVKGPSPSADTAEQAEPPTPAQTAAGDQLASITQRIIKSGQMTGADRRALRDAAVDADPARREEMLLSVVRAINAQQLKPTEPGPFF